MDIQTTQAFTQAASMNVAFFTDAEIAKEAIKFVVENATTITLTTTFVAAAGWLKSWRNNRALKQGKFDGNSILMGYTFYAPTGLANEDMTAELIEQRIRTLEHEVNLEEIFGEVLSPKALSYIQKAKKYCAQEEPLVFQHLDKVIPKKDYENISTAILKQMKNYFGGLLTDSKETLLNLAEIDKSGDPRLVLSEFDIYPVLINEPGAKKKQMRILFIIGESGLDVKPEDLLVSSPEQFLRLETINSIHNQSEEVTNKWIRGARAAIPDGRIVRVEPPVLLDESTANAL